MAVNIDIRLKRADKVYHENDNLSGVVVVTTNSDLKHDGISLTVEGSIALQLSSKNVGLIDAFYNSVKPIQLINITCDVSGSGRLPSGTTEIPFEIPLKSKTNRTTLYETYHGVYVNINYNIRCDIRRSFLSKDLQKTQQFLIQYKSTDKTKRDKKPIDFTLSPSNLAMGNVNVPDFFVKGYLDATCCNIMKPFTGYLVLERCDAPIRSVELQLVRVETCGCAEGYSREATEIQNIQIGDGDIPPNVRIPIYMIFPRLFTCPTLITTNFKIEFEVNLVIVFEDDHLVTNNFHIVLIRE